MSLKDLLNKESKINHLKVKILSKHEDKFIVGDSSMMAIFNASNKDQQNLIEGKCYMLLKPIKLDEKSFICNEKVKAVLISDFSLPYKKNEVNQMKSLLNSTVYKHSAVTVNPSLTIKTFDQICLLPDKSIVATVIAKVITKSKDINGAYGPYNISKLKDIEGSKIDINLYSNSIRKKINRGDVIELKQLKLTKFERNGETVNRLQTTGRTTVQRPIEAIDKMFENISLGDKREVGTVLAVHNVYPYTSCTKCWKRIDSDEANCSCGHVEEKHSIDFYCQFYVQSKNDENVHIIKTFRRQTEVICEIEDSETIQCQLDETFVGKDCTFEWDIISVIDEEEELQMVSIKHAL